MERLAAAALKRPGSIRNLDALAAETRTSVPALEQVAHLLRLAGLLVAAQGSIRRHTPLATRLRDLHLEVVRAIDGEGLWGSGILGLAKCSDNAPCPAHLVWKKTREVLSQHLEDQSLADLTRAVEERRRINRSSSMCSR